MLEPFGEECDGLAFLPKVTLEARRPVGQGENLGLVVLRRQPSEEGEEGQTSLVGDDLGGGGQEFMRGESQDSRYADDEHKKSERNGEATVQMDVG